MKKLITVVTALIITAGVIFFLTRNREIPVKPEKEISRTSQPVPEKNQAEPEKSLPEEKPSEKPGEKTAPQTAVPTNILTINRDKLLSLEIDKGQSKTLLSRSGEGWTLNGCESRWVSAKKAEQAISPFLSLTGTEASTETHTGKVIEKITLKTAEGETELTLMEPADGKKGYYLSLNIEKGLYFISESTGSALVLNPDDIRNRTIPLFRTDQLDSMTIQNGVTIKVIPYVKSDMFTADSYRFMLEAPYRAYVPVDQKEMDRLLVEMGTQMNIGNFIDNGRPEDYGIDKNSKMLKIHEKTGKTFELLVGNNAGDSSVYGKLAGSNQIFTLEKDQLPFLKIRPFDLVDKIPQMIDESLIESFTLTTADVAIICDKENRSGTDTYSVNGIETEKQNYDDLFNRILNVPLRGEVKDFNPVGTPYMDLSFKLRDGGTQWTHLSFYKMGDKRLAVVRNDNPPLFYVSIGDADAMVDGATAETDKIMGF